MTLLISKTKKDWTFKEIKTQEFTVNGPQGSAESESIAGKSKTQFAWNLGAGINYAVNERIDLNLIKYQFSALGYSETKPDDEGKPRKNKLKVNTLSAGVTFKF